MLDALCGDPAPFQHPDGSWSMVCDLFPCDFYVATAPHYAGPWTIHKSLGGCNEANVAISGDAECGTTSRAPNPTPWKTWLHCNASWPNASYTASNPRSGAQMEVSERGEVTGPADAFPPKKGDGRKNGRTVEKQRAPLPPV